MLLNIMKVNKEININVEPKWEERIKALNSLCKLYRIFLHNKDQRDGELQYKYGINIIPKIVDIQLIDRFRILEEGSKIENKFIIIFSV